MDSSHRDSDLKKRDGACGDDNNSGAGPSSSTSNGKRKGCSNSGEPAKKQRADSYINSLDEGTVQVRSEPWDKKESYSKSGLTNTLHGVIYQLKHLMLVLKLAWDQGYHFRLATEMDAAEKFDDLVFEYEENPGSRKHLFVQLKHKQEDSKTISARELRADDGGDFSVIKYFRSWRKIKQAPEFKGSKSRMKGFILCTNIGINKKELKGENIRVQKVNELEGFLNDAHDETRSRCYKLTPDPQSKLFATLKSASDLHQLAKELAICVDNSKPLHRKTDLFRRYDFALIAEEVVDINTIAKFSKKFITNKGLSSKAEKFREIFYEYAKKFKVNKNATDEADIWNRLENYQFKKSKDFGKSASASQVAELPDDDISDNKISKFFGNFILAVNQPNEKQLDELIARAFGESSRFKLLNLEFIRGSFQDDILTWFKRKSGEYLNREDATKIMGALAQRLSSVITMGLTLRYPQQLEEYNVRWKNVNEALRTYLQSSNSTENKIMLQITSSEQTLLTSSRIYQTVMSMDEYTKEDSFIFMKLKDLLPTKSKNHVFSAFSSSKNHNLLIIDCGLHCADQNTGELWKEMCDTTKKLRAEKITGKRVIIIIPQKDMEVVELNSLNCKYSVETKEDISIDKMKRTTRQKLLKKEVIVFQGRDKKTSYGCLLGGENFATEELEKIKGYKKIMNPKTLVKIIHGTEIKIGAESEGLGEILDYCIPRTIEHHVVIKNDIFKSTTGLQDIFAIGGIDATTLEKLWKDENRKKESHSREMKHRDRNKYVILQNGREAEHFGDLCRENTTRNIHRLQRESKKLVWKESHGSIVNLVKYREETRSSADADVTLLTEEELAECRDNLPKIIILSDTAGMGKSIVLTRLAEEIKKGESSLLVIKINLTDHTKVLSEQKNRSFASDDYNGAVDFLVDKLIPGLEPEAVLVFKTMIKMPRRAALLFDGFDEISPYYEKIVADLIHRLSKFEVKKVFVTTRPETSRQLEEKLELFSHALQPFSERNQLKFLTKFWKSKIGSSQNKDGIRRHVKRLIVLLTKSIDPSMQEFTGVPLQTRMVAEVFPPTKALPQTMKIIDLYDGFVKTKYDIYMKDKSNHDFSKPAYMDNYRQYYETFSIEHYKFSLDILFDVETVGLLMRQQSSVPTTDEAMTRKGMIIQFIDGKPQFIHRTFAEYFAAEFLFKILMDDSRNQPVREFFVGRLFLLPEYRVIRAFLNCLLANEELVGQENSWEFDLSDHPNLEGQTAYHVAARERHVGIVRFLLNRLTENREIIYSNINCRSEDGSTPLKSAVETVDNFKVVQCFVDAGADVNQGDSWRQGKPLEAAIRSDVNFDVIEYLIEKSDPKVEPEIVTSALYIAAMMGKLDLVKYLIQNGGDINSNAYHHGATPLHVAAGYGKQDVLQYLILEGANVDSRDDSDETPLHSATRSHHLDTVKCLVENHAIIGLRNHAGETPLHLAVSDLVVEEYLDKVESDRYEAMRIRDSCESYLESNRFPWKVTYDSFNVVEYLLRNGAEINSQTNDGSTPLHYAADSYTSRVSRNLNVVQYLLDKGADINLQRKDGDTVLRIAARDRDHGLVQFLLEKNGIIIDSRDATGATALHIAAQYGGKDIVKKLKKHHANIKSSDNCGRTAMHYVSDIPCRWGQNRFLPFYLGKTEQLVLIKYLKKKGVDIESKSKRGETPLYFAAKRGNIDLVKYFTEQGANIHVKTNDGETLLHAAAEEASIEIMMYLIEKGLTDIQAETKDGKTPLHEAARRGHLEFVTYLIENDALIHSRTHDGQTCMHYAARFGELDVVRYLAGKGLSIDSSSDDGTTPLHSAVMYYNDCKIEESLRYAHSGDNWRALQVVKFLTYEGADINCQTKDGLTPLHSAAKGDALEVVEFLTDEGACIHRETKDGKTPLQLAAEHKAITVQNYLTKKLEQHTLLRCPFNSQPLNNQQISPHETPE